MLYGVSPLAPSLNRAMSGCRGLKLKSKHTSSILEMFINGRHVIRFILTQKSGNLGPTGV